jgi:hypothetical protein
MQPAYASPATLPPGRSTPPPAGVTPAPGVQQLPPTIPHGTNPPPVGQFPSVPGSGSGPAHKLQSTRHGYAGANDLSYPRYEAPPVPAEDVAQLKPNRRPLFIGLGIVVVAVFLAIRIGNSGHEVKSANKAPETGSDQPAQPEQPTVTPTAVIDAAAQADLPPPVVEESSISLKITSDPAGADVLLFGKVIGTTPLDRQIEKGSGQAMIVVHKGGYVDTETKIDLTADFETTIVLKKVDEPETPIAEVKDPPKEPKKEPKAQIKKDPPKEPKRERGGASGGTTVKKDPPKETPKDPPKDPPKEPKKELKGCQPQGQYDPFNDPRPVCK